MAMKPDWAILYTDTVPIHMGHELVLKQITIKEQRGEEQLIQLFVEITTQSDPFDTYSVVINELDYEQKFKHEQQVTAPFQDFGMLLVEILKQLGDPQQKYDAYLESLNSVKSNLVITYTTLLKNTNQLVIEVLKVSNDQLRNVVYSMIDNLKLKINQLEDQNDNLTKKLEEIEEKLEAVNIAKFYDEKYLQELAKQEQENIEVLDSQYNQNVDDYLNQLAKKTSSLHNMKIEYARLQIMKEECVQKKRAIYLQLENVEREKKECNQRRLFMEEKNKTLEKKQTELIASLAYFQKIIEKNNAAIEEYGQFVAVKNREHDKLLCRLAKAEEELKQHHARPRDTNVGDAVKEEEPSNTVPKCTVRDYHQTKFPEDKDKQ